MSRAKALTSGVVALGAAYAPAALSAWLASSIRATMLASDKPLSGVAGGIESCRAVGVESVLTEGFSAVPVAVAELCLLLHAPARVSSTRTAASSEPLRDFGSDTGGPPFYRRIASVT